MATENLLWTKVQPTIRTWAATDGADSFEMTITNAGGAYFAVQLKKNGLDRGTVQAETVEQIADLFETVATDLRSEGF
jgi:hypothetical protein